MNSDNEKDVANDADLVQLLSGMEEKLVAYWVAGGPSFHEQVLADDWQVIDGSGHILSRAQVLAESFSGDRQVISGEIDEINVRAFGDWAIVTGRTHILGRFGGNDMEITLRFTDVFSCHHGIWKVEASQATLIT